MYTNIIPVNIFLCEISFVNKCSEQFNVGDQKYQFVNNFHPF